MSFIREISDCEAIVTGALCLGQIPSGVSLGKTPKFFYLLNIFKRIKWHFLDHAYSFLMSFIKKLYAWPKKLYQ